MFWTRVFDQSEHAEKVVRSAGNVAGGGPRMTEFANTYRRGQKLHYNDFGDIYVVRRRQEQWNKQFRFYPLGSDCLPTHDYPSGRNWWRKNGTAAVHATAEILDRFAKL
jgi:hypothetical protein